MTFRARDGTSDSNMATVTITITANAVAPPPEPATRLYLLLLQRAPAGARRADDADGGRPRLCSGEEPPRWHAGSTVYVQVDSASIGSPYGAVDEADEQDGGTYINIAKLVVAMDVVLPANALATTPAAPPCQLPTRPE